MSNVADTRNAPRFSTAGMSSSRSRGHVDMLGDDSLEPALQMLKAEAEELRPGGGHGEVGRKVERAERFRVVHGGERHLPRRALHHPRDVAMEVEGRQGPVARGV